MAQYLEIRGLPRQIALDGWWFDGGADAAGPAGPETGGADHARRVRFRGLKHRWPAMLALVVLADFLFWDRPIGLSLALFALMVFLLAGHGQPLWRRFRAGLVCLIGVLPVVEHLQALSVIFLTLGLAMALTLQAAPSRDPAASLRRLPGFLIGLLHLWLQLPLAATRPLRRDSTGWEGLSSGALRQMRVWAFPLGGSLIFLVLLSEANPLVPHLARELMTFDRILPRIAFWGGMALFLVPFLLPAETVTAELRPVGTTWIRPGLGLNPASVLHALVLFNLLIGLQMTSDLAILIGGAHLPEGMTYAKYARQGAYPLLATAMLAMIFALLASSFRKSHRMILPLMALWLVQNILLTGAAVLRLDLYISVYGLTYLRLYALIWMGLVAFGLGLALIQVVLGRDARWLVLRGAAGALITLYLCAFVNFAALIATRNLSPSHHDVPYACSLGPMAAGSFAAAGIDQDSLGLNDHSAPGLCPGLVPPAYHGWRDWGLRGWRVNHMLARNSGAGQGG